MYRQITRDCVLLSPNGLELAMTKTAVPEGASGARPGVRRNRRCSCRRCPWRGSRRQDRSKVGTETAFAPFDFIDAGQHVGLNVGPLSGDRTGDGRQDRLGSAAVGGGCLPGLEAGKFDMGGGSRHDHQGPDATATVSCRPIGEATDALMKRKGDTSVMKPADIAGKTVGAGKASSQLAQLQDYAKTLPAKVTVSRIRGQQRSLRGSRGRPPSPRSPTA